VESIVIDGSRNFSSDTSTVIRNDHEPEYLLVQGPDAGIYDAMNKGAVLAKGRYVWFLNGGDVGLLDDISVIEPFLRSDFDILLCSYILEMGRGSVRRRSRDQSYIKHALPTSHQAILYRRDVLGNEPYDLAYPISSDYALTAWLLSSGSRALRVDIAVARFAAGGTSTKSARLIAREAWRVQRDVLGVSARWRVISQVRHAVARTNWRILYHLTSRPDRRLSRVRG